MLSLISQKLLSLTDTELEEAYDDGIDFFKNPKKLSPTKKLVILVKYVLK
jgi:hypothetical protein